MAEIADSKRPTERLFLSRRAFLFPLGAFAFVVVTVHVQELPARGGLSHASD